MPSFCPLTLHCSTGAIQLQVQIQVQLQQQQQRQQGNYQKPKKPMHYGNDCIFLALSCVFMVLNGIFSPKTKISSKPNLKTAKTLKQIFFKWVKNVKKLQIKQIFDERGLNLQGFNLCEAFFRYDFEIWKQINIPKTILTKTGIKKAKIITKKLRLEKASKNYYGTKIAFLQTDTTYHNSIKHLKCLTGNISLSRKHLCERCHIGFGERFQLAKHQLNCGVIKFLPERTIKISVPIELQLENLLNNFNVQFFKDGWFLFLDFYKSTSGFCFEIFENYRPNAKVLLRHNSLDDLCLQILTFTNSVSKSIKTTRLSENIKLLAFLSNLQIINPLLSPQINNILAKVKQYICHVPVFIGLKDTDQNFTTKLIKAFIKSQLINNSIETIHIQSRRGTVNQLLLSGPTSGIQILFVHDIFPNHFNKPNEQSITCFQRMCSKLISFFGIDITTGFIGSFTQVAKFFFDRSLEIGKNITMISPPERLYKALKTCCRYGVLQATQAIVHPTLNYKSFFQFDIKKHYLNILSNIDMYYGNPIELEKENKTYKIVSKRLHHTTFANILIQSISMATTASIQYILSGREARIYNIPVDAFIQFPTSKGRKTVIFNHHGCYWHAHGMANGAKQDHCHMPFPSKEHKMNCKICSAASQPPKSSHRPPLWKCPVFDTNVKHPHKHNSYKTIAEDTKRIDERLKQSPKVDNYVSVYSCELIPIWDSPLINFVKQLGLPVNSSFPKTKTLGQCFSDCLKNQFPVMQNKMISIQSLVTSCKKGLLHGLLRVTGYIGQETINSLNGFEIFSHLDDNKKMVNSNTLNNTFISSNMLKFLLTSNKIKDFYLTDISELFLWPNISIKPYKSVCQNIKNVISINTGDPEFLSLCKNLANLYIGNLAYCPNKYMTTQLMNHEQFESLSNIKNLSTTQSINDTTMLAKFKTQKHHFNSIHNNFLVIQHSRIIFIEMLLSFLEFLDLTPMSANCDGVLFVSTKPLAPYASRGENDKYPLLLLDACLKPALNKANLQSYLWLKEKYFENTLCCGIHASKYIDSLFKNIPFYPSECCIQYKSPNNFLHKLKIECLGEKCVVFGINKSCVYDEISKNTVIKCSGMKIRNIDTVFKKAPPELKELFLS